MTNKKIDDIATAVKAAVESVPSHALLIAARAKFAELTNSANAELGEIERLKKLALEGADSLVGRAKALLSGKPITDGPLVEAIGAAKLRADVFQESMKIQAGVVAALENKLFIEANAALQSLRQPLVTRMVNALAELRLISAADAEINAAASMSGVKGINGMEAGVTIHPVMKGIPAEHNWLQWVRSQGYTV